MPWSGSFAPALMPNLCLSPPHSPTTDDENDFFDMLDTYFHAVYDIKYIMKTCSDLNHKAGLSQLAEELAVERIGPCHQAGSDSLITCPGQCLPRVGGGRTSPPSATSKQTVISSSQLISAVISCSPLILCNSRFLLLHSGQSTHVSPSLHQGWLGQLGPAVPSRSWSRLGLILKSCQEVVCVFFSPDVASRGGSTSVFWSTVLGGPLWERSRGDGNETGFLVGSSGSEVTTSIFAFTLTGKPEGCSVTQYDKFERQVAVGLRRSEAGAPPPPHVLQDDQDARQELPVLGLPLAERIVRPRPGHHQLGRPQPCLSPTPSPSALSPVSNRSPPPPRAPRARLSDPPGIAVSPQQAIVRAGPLDPAL